MENTLYSTGRNGQKKFLKRNVKSYTLKQNTG